MSSHPIHEELPEKYLVPGLKRGLHLLAEFGVEDRQLAAPELARRLNVPRSTAFRLLSTLELMGFVERVEGGREYRLGMAVLRLGFEYLASLELSELGRPLLDRLRDDIQYPCNLVVRDGRSNVYVARSISNRPFSSSVNVGTRLPAHATVMGRVLLADLSLSELRELYPEPQLEAFSANTPRTVEDLYKLVQRDREDGFVLQEGFFDANLSTIAAPVLDRTGKVVAALGATIPSSQLELLELVPMIERVRATALELSYSLDYRPVGGSVVNLIRN